VGEIDLLREIRLDNTGIANYRRERPGVRRVYIGKIAKVGRDGHCLSREGCSRGAFYYYSRSILRLTFTGIARGHGSLLTASVWKICAPQS
jgi:hypothetical protein